MGVHQHYYTSYMNKITGNAGFQVKAMSPGITPDVQALIARLIAYRIPPSLDEHRLNSHPVALRYYYGGPDMCILLCSRSNGTDDNGRPGNFFAHTLLLDPNTLASVPPIFYWQSPFWRKEDREARSNIASLPVLTSFDAEVLLEEDEIWQFLKRDKRRYEQLYQLLCAVVHSTKAQRRVVILDTTEHVALWIAAISCLLPPAYRPLLTFATYHHDPYQAQYLITGTTTDAGFRATPEEYLSFFILNAETGVPCQVEDSAYAKMAVEFVRKGLYETALLDVFTDYAPFFPEPKLDEQLDLLAVYADLRKNSPREALNAQQLQAIRTVVATLKKSVTTSRPSEEAFERAIQELNTLVITLREVFNASRDMAAQEELHNIVAFMRVRGLPVNEFILYEIKVITERLLFGNGQGEMTTTLQSLRSDYGAETIADIINSVDYLEWLAEKFAQASYEQRQAFWQYLGKYLQPEGQCPAIVLMSFDMLHQLRESGYAEARKNFCRAMCDALQVRRWEWMRLIAYNDQIPTDALRFFYYYMVYSLVLDQRGPYRDLVREAIPDIVLYEFRSDLYYTRAEQKFAKFEEWISHAKRCNEDTASLLIAGWQRLSEKCKSSQDRQKLAEQILMSQSLAPLPQKLEGELVEQIFSTLSFSNFVAKDLALYKQYYNSPALSVQTSLIIRGIEAIINGKLDRKLAEEIAVSWHGVDVLQYKAMVAHCLPIFFKNDVSPEAHYNLFWAFFPAMPEDSAAGVFWEEYSMTFTKMFSSPQTIYKIVQLFDFWFDARPENFRSLSYVLQNFFLYLPFFDFVQPNPSFNKLAESRRWFPSMKFLFLPRKSVATVIGNFAGTGIKKVIALRSNPASEQEKGKQTNDIETEIAQLFNSKRPVEEAHQEWLVKLYNHYPQEEFWPHLYWKGLTAILQAQDVDTVLAVLSFWFDESFERFGHVPYMPHQFFWWLPRWLREVHEKQELFRVVKAVYVRAQSDEAHYPWHPLLGKVLTGKVS